MATLARAAAHRARASDPEEKTKKLAKASHPPKPVGLQRVNSASRSSHAAKDPCAGPSTSDPEEKTKKLQPACSEPQHQPLRMTSATRSSPNKRKAAPSSDPTEKTKKLPKSAQSSRPHSLITQFLL